MHRDVLQRLSSFLGGSLQISDCHPLANIYRLCKCKNSMKIVKKSVNETIIMKATKSCIVKGEELCQRDDVMSAMDHSFLAYTLLV